MCKINTLVFISCSTCSIRSLAVDKLKIRKLTGKEVPLTAECAPLVPPNYYGSTDVSDSSSTFLERYCQDVNDARTMFKQLRSKRLSVFTRRQYVFGARYVGPCSGPCFPKVLLLNPSMEGYDITVSLGDDASTTTYIGIRNIGMKRIGLACQIVEFGDLCNGRLFGGGNARSKCGDLGSMQAFGLKSATRNSIYVPTYKLGRELELLSRAFRHCVESEFPDVVAQMDLLESERKSHCDFIPEGPGSFANCSTNLSNSPHYDVNDVGMSAVIWVARKPGVAKHWYFIFPNLKVDGYEGAVIKICHGTLLVWDARVLYHASWQPVVGSGNCVYGYLQGNAST